MKNKKLFCSFVLGPPILPVKDNEGAWAREPSGAGRWAVKNDGTYSEYVLHFLLSSTSFF